jgi:hypothetical protein
MSPEFRAFCRQHYGWLLLATFSVVATFLTACQTSTTDHAWRAMARASSGEGRSGSTIRARRQSGSLE